MDILLPQWQCTIQRAVKVFRNAKNILKCYSTTKSMHTFVHIKGHRINKYMDTDVHCKKRVTWNNGILLKAFHSLVWVFSEAKFDFRMKKKRNCVFQNGFSSWVWKLFSHLNEVWCVHILLILHKSDRVLKDP